MTRRKGRIVAAAAAVCLLAAAWAIGGNYAGRDGSLPEPGGAGAAGRLSASGAEGAEASAAADGGAAHPPSETPAGPETPAGFETPAGPETPAPAQAGTGAGAAPGAAVDPAVAVEGPAPEGPEAGTAGGADAGAGADRYLTDPVPEGRPLPVEPQDAAVTDGELSATLTVRCDTILGNMGLLAEEKWGLVPADGVILPTTEIVFYEGESVFNVLQREMKRARIHMEFMNTPIYNSAYIEGINNIYEFDVGELSGWMYQVNGWYPNYGSSRYQLKDGDAVEWHFTCDLGRDLGVDWIERKQRDA
ncbi:MAG: DUF4430 domain-containing protein [Clostridiales Family XIII bacterium]|jgi:hypothetical protein|nr:DUF4430 domain-containing protein [Clostridiales Family XIII bacterium]